MKHFSILNASGLETQCEDDKFSKLNELCLDREDSWYCHFHGPRWTKMDQNRFQGPNILNFQNYFCSNQPKFDYLINPKWFTFKKLVIGLPGAISVQAIIFYLFLLEIIIRSFQKNLTKCKKYFSAKKIFFTAKKGPKTLFFIKKIFFLTKFFLQKNIVHLEKIKVKFSQNFWMTISSKIRQNKIAQTEMAPGKPIRVNNLESIPQRNPIPYRRDHLSLSSYCHQFHLQLFSSVVTLLLLWWRWCSYELSS